MLLQTDYSHKKLKVSSWAVLFLFAFNFCFAQQLITIKADNGNYNLFADLYLQSPSNPYIVLLHSQNSSRGEFTELAPALNNLNYNCLAVDLSNGQRFEYTKNKTVHENRITLNDQKSISDQIEGAIEYAYNKSKQPVLIFASGINASYALITAKNNVKVKALTVLNPFDALPDGTYLNGKMKPFDKPVLFVISKKNKIYYTDLTLQVPKNIKSIYLLNYTEGKNFNEIITHPDEKKTLWMEFLLFFKKMKSDVPYLN